MHLQRRLDQHLHDDRRPEGARLVKRCLFPVHGLEVIQLQKEVDMSIFYTISLLKIIYEAEDRRRNQSL